MPRKKKTHELNDKQLLKTLFHPKVLKQLKKEAAKSVRK